MFPSSIEKQFPQFTAYCDVRDVGKVAKDWPQLNFVICHSAYCHAGGGTAEEGWNEFQKTGRISWTSDLADRGDTFAGMKEDCLKNGAARSNLRYDYVRNPESAA